MGTSILSLKLLLTMSTLVTPFLLLLAMLVHNQASPLPGTCTEACTTTCVNGECHQSCTKECTRRKRDPHPLKTKREDVDSLLLKEQKDDNDDDDQYEDMNAETDIYGDPSCEWHDSLELCL